MHLRAEAVAAAVSGLALIWVAEVVAALCAILRLSWDHRPRRCPSFENRIPAPLSSPAQAPLVNGPMSQPAFRGMTGIGQ